ncbi:MAG: metal-dependent transcriptional regulator [Thermoplasmata archaeon]
MSPGELYGNKRNAGDSASGSLRRNTVTEEDYLKIIDELTGYKGFASFSDISHKLGVRRQSARDEINRLMIFQLIEKKGKGKYALTDNGKREANIFLRKHRTAEILLNKCIGIPWEDVDEQAMGIEHGMTEEIIKNTLNRFGSTKCPHGNPIPDENGFVVMPEDTDVSVLKGEYNVVLSRVIYETRDILQYLSSLGLYPGSQTKFINDGKYFFEIGGKRIQVSSDIIKAVRFTIVK